MVGQPFLADTGAELGIGNWEWGMGADSRGSAKQPDSELLKKLARRLTRTLLPYSIRMNKIRSSESSALAAADGDFFFAVRARRISR